MKNNSSLVALLIVFSAFVFYRFQYPKELGDNRPLQVTTWDALGYYMYLPGTFIYGDMEQYTWFPDIDEKYGLSGGYFYQAGYDKELDVYVTKYTGGLAVLQLPFFAVAHLYAKNSTIHPADGFSLPYQVAVCVGALFYMLIGLWFLRKILLHYFHDKVTAITLILIGLTTNIIQYASIDSAMSHSYIFFVYPLVIWTTIKWHENPKLARAAIIGWLIGIATICRPTEALMILIPILWTTHTKAAAKEKWKLVWANKNSIATFIVFGIIGILPQLVYWQIITGSPIYSMGSKWFFLTPWFRVLFGINNGWFIYTPIAISFVVGFFFMKNRPFQKSVLWFSLLTIWAVTAWSDWRYGATYSCRALSQSLGVFALPLACTIDRLSTWKYKLTLLPLGAFMIYVNLVQIHQYNSTVLHYHDMNWAYYQSIFLDKSPTPLAMSLLDNEDFLDSEAGYTKNELIKMTGTYAIPANEGSAMLADTALNLQTSTSDQWIRISLENTIDQMVSNGFILSRVLTADTILINKVRIYNPLTIGKKVNKQDYYVRIPAGIKVQRLEVKMEADRAIVGSFGQLEIIELAQD